MDCLPLLTVISATINLVKNQREKSFREMADSVIALRQYLPVEHLIQDGNSDDGSQEIYHRYGDMLQVTSEPDHGVYDAMNHAAGQAQGKYLSFLNSDDYYHAPEVLAELLGQMEKNGADYAFAPIRRIRRDGRTEIRQPKMYSIFQRMPYCHQSLIVRKSVFEELKGYDTQFRIVADHDFALRLYLAGKRSLCGKTAFATFRSGGLSKDKGKNHQERTEIFRKLYSGFYDTDRATFQQMAAGKKFPLPLFLELLKHASPGDRLPMRWWYFCNLFRFM